MERPGSTFPPLTHTPRFKIEEGEAYLVDDNEQLPYQLLRNLGHGHSGNVEEVKDINTGRLFARKIMRIRGGRSGKHRKKIFDNEIQIIRSLTGHHHVIQVFATYVSKYEVGLILYPVADEGDLERFLGSFSQSSPDCESPDIDDIDMAKVDILKRSFGCLANGLEFMHQRKIRHKDIKPRNILVHQGSVIYTDFGYSLDSSLEGHSTTTGRPDCLTRRYSAPEVIDFMPRNSGSDVFSLGCVFLDILSTLTKVLDIDSDQCYYELMSSIHTHMSGSSIPISFRFLVKIVISMTLANSAERSTAAEVAGILREYPGFLCDRCQPPQGTQLPLRQARNMVELDDSNNVRQESIPVNRIKATSGRRVEEGLLPGGWHQDFDDIGSGHNLKTGSNSDLAEAALKHPVSAVKHRRASSEQPSKVPFPIPEPKPKAKIIAPPPTDITNAPPPHPPSPPPPTPTRPISPLFAALDEIDALSSHRGRNASSSSRRRSRRLRHQFQSPEEEAEYRAWKEMRRATRAKRELDVSGGRYGSVSLDTHVDDAPPPPPPPVELEPETIPKPELGLVEERPRSLLIEGAAPVASVVSTSSAERRERRRISRRVSVVEHVQPKSHRISASEKPVSRRTESDRPRPRRSETVKSSRHKKDEAGLGAFFKGLKKMVA